MSGLYERILGDAWQVLPQQIRDMHEVTGRGQAEGRASVDRGTGLLSRSVGRAMGFPAETQDTPIRVTFDASPRGELWTREFGDARFSSRQFPSADGLLGERFGPLSFVMALIATPDRLSLVLHRWSVLGVRLPMSLTPRATAHESVENGRFHFHVEIRHDLIGLLVRYRGWLDAPRPIPRCRRSRA